MRKFSGSVIAMLVFALPGAAQQPQENLDTVLRGWEKAMTDVKSFAVVIERTANDKSLNARDDYKGHALFVKGATAGVPHRARLELYKSTDAKIYEKYICTGTFLYEYAADAKEVRIHDMPQNKPIGVQQESFLSFMFGMSSENAKQRYFMEHVGSDKFYHYIRILPKTELDKADFAEARLSLLRSNNLPAQIYYNQPNKNEITWNFTKYQLDVQIPLNYFATDTPQGWQVRRMPPPGAGLKQPMLPRTKP